MNNKEFEDFLFNHEKVEYISNGIYDVTGIEFIVGNKYNSFNIIEWLKNKDKFWITDDNLTDYFILYESKPKKYYGKYHSSDYFNTDIVNMFTNCPKDILILEGN